MSAGGFVLAIVLVGIGGGLGSVARWALREAGVRRAAGRPGGADGRARHWMTFVANILACFVLGAVVGRLGSATGTGELLYLTLAAGFCGGLSTLSTAALDVVDMVRGGSYAISLAYLLLSIGVGMASLWMGLVIVT
ncbi:CrcB family protein [Brachybacterium sp. YJGR34]|uniref:fluoride efflux transporter FluC n=1 Tax=Brachybacterium sp. YJGR34 TaxID=2059911 RepID=UPI000E0BF8D3|nr:CrcB family protein [Brachybacterium sp. YJGR34]